MASKYCVTLAINARADLIVEAGSKSEALEIAKIDATDALNEEWISFTPISVEELEEEGSMNA